MTRPVSDVRNLGYVLQVVGTMLSLDQISSLSIYPRDDGQNLIEVALAAGETVGGFAHFGEDGDDVGWAMMSVFDALQQGLTESAAFWGEALPGCRPGHVHPAWCRYTGHVVELYCPADELSLRTLAILPRQSPV